MFRKLFGGGAPKSSAYEAGQKLFQQGMKAASEYRTAEAVALYTKSVEANPNPAPLINRAKLYRYRLLFDEAIRDLELAMRLDKQQGKQFSIPLEKELTECRFLAQHRLSGQRDSFIADLQKKGYDYVAGRIVDSIFDGNGQLLGYHLIDEIDNINKFEDLSEFPAAKTLLVNWIKDHSLIDRVLANPALREEYQDKRTVFEIMICAYDYADMAKLRDTIIRKVWCLLNPPSQFQDFWEASLRNPGLSGQ